MKKIHLLCFLTFAICFESIAQNNRLITGTVTNLENGTALPFASISLKKQLIGTVTNENGEFGFLIPENIVNVPVTIKAPTHLFACGDSLILRP
mgnify:CR=1 FL=1